eukprot:TRINITY_DN18022_c0_g1_i14.p1 TRINITY_DN18022_c0_g1~~TRINITY_DN18022_c0_g1_i14.p1  ORF type:complete len:101 (-),score=16.41 TRINITY_DN18022_c0_g1_i14:1262-1564(-)
MSDIGEIRELRGRTSVSPSKQVATIAAWTPQVVPPTRNHISVEPNNLDALFCASSGEKAVSLNRSLEVRNLAMCFFHAKKENRLFQTLEERLRTRISGVS